MRAYLHRRRGVEVRLDLHSQVARVPVGVAARGLVLDHEHRCKVGRAGAEMVIAVVVVVVAWMRGRVLFQGRVVVCERGFGQGARTRAVKKIVVSTFVI